MEASKIVKIANALMAQRSTLDNTYQIIEKFVRPFSGEFFKPLTSSHEVDWRRRGIYDSTAIVAADLLAGQIHANLVSPAVKWFDFQFRDEDAQKDIEAQKWLDDLEEACWKALSESDFNLEVAEFLTDIVTYGDGVMFEEEENEERWEGLDFTAIPVMDCYHEPDAKGGLARLYRRLRYTNLQLMDRFEMPPEWIQAHENEDEPDKKHLVWFCIYERPQESKDYKRMDIKPKHIAPKLRPWGYKYVMDDTKMELEEGGYYEMPAFRTMWKKTAGSHNGHSPAFIALSDILQLNEVVKQSSEARAKAIDPATITTERGIIGDLDLEPGGLTMVTEMDQLKVLESAARFDVQDQEIYRLQTSIRSVFFIDKLELKDSPAMTATEVNVRYDRMMRQFASTLGRLQSDFLDKLLHLTINIMMRRGVFAAPPESIAGKEFDIVYTGPIPRAQQAEIAGAIEALMADFTAIAQVPQFEELLDLIDIDKMGHELGKVRGVPTRIYRSAEDVKKIRANRAAQRQAEQDIAMTQGAGDAMTAVGKGQAMINGAQGG